jgi:hypothetical protein
VNGHSAGKRWSLPFVLRIGKYLKPGSNLLEIEVTNLSANRIRDLDRTNVPWKVFHNINIVNQEYEPFDASNWPLEPSGLTEPLRLRPMKLLQLQDGSNQ